MIPAGVPTGAPNILLIVRGRRSGIERTTPVAMLDFDGHSYVQASYGAMGWARNLRAAGEATIIYSGGRSCPVHAIEVPSDEAAAILRRVLEPYRQLGFVRRLLGSRVRPPVALLRRYRIRIDDTPRITSPKLGATRCSNSDPRNDHNELFAVTGPVARQCTPHRSQPPTTGRMLHRHKHDGLGVRGRTVAQVAESLDNDGVTEQRN
jgi:deazaflavin-dependent oxidoreductase (nitroreductase family)